MWWESFRTMSKKREGGMMLLLNSYLYVYLPWYLGKVVINIDGMAFNILENDLAVWGMDMMNHYLHTMYHSLP